MNGECRGKKSLQIFWAKRYEKHMLNGESFIPFTHTYHAVKNTKNTGLSPPQFSWVIQTCDHLTKYLVI